MGYSAEILADSVNPAGVRITTMQVRMPRFVLAEFNTHRVFSRNSASSRAIPVERRIAQVLEDPVIPLEWGRNRPGMQATEIIDNADEKLLCEAHWLQARDEAVAQAKWLSAFGIHKQVVNRLLEPWVWIDVVVTSTEWQNFFAQRNSELAQPEIRRVAELMQQERDDSVPVLLAVGEWHLPYVTPEDRAFLVGSMYGSDAPARLSTARCARVSYKPFGPNGEPLPERVDRDINLFWKLREARPPHWSPFEHPAMARDDAELHFSNLRGFTSYRKTFSGESGEELNWTAGPASDEARHDDVDPQ